MSTNPPRAISYLLYIFSAFLRGAGEKEDSLGYLHILCDVRVQRLLH